MAQVDATSLRRSVVLKPTVLSYFILAILLVSVISGIIPSCYSEEQITPQPTGSGVINRERFSRSVPNIMIVGQTYMVVVEVTNTGSTESGFIVELNWPFRASLKYFFISGILWKRSIVLAPGQSGGLQFAIMPLVEHAGQLEIVASLYLFAEDTTILLDSASTTVYQLKLSVPEELLTWILIVCVSLLAMAVTILFFKKPAWRRDLAVSLFVFASAIILRAPNPLNVAIHPDEIIIWQVGCNVLYNNWTWTTEMMLNPYPPVYWYLEAFMIYLAGTQFEVFRFFSVVASSLTAVVVYMLGKSIFNRLTGFLSAVLFSFSSYTILVSRISLTDSFVLLIALGSVYFLWRGYHSKETKYMALSGVLLGLAFDTKYIAACAFLGSLMFIAWVSRDLKSIFRKNSLIWLISFIVVISPVQISLLMNQANPYLIYWEYYAFPQTREVPQMYLMDIPAEGLRLFIYVLTRSANPWLPWIDILEFISVTLLPLAVIYHIYPSLKARPRESFLVISFLATLPPLIIPSMHSYWTIYSFPYLFIMVTNLAVQAWRGFSNSKLVKAFPRLMKYVGALRAATLFLAVVFFSSQLITGVVSPAIDKGEFESFRQAMIFVKDRVDSGDIIADLTGRRALYYINEYDLNITEIPFAYTPPEQKPEVELWVPPLSLQASFNPSILYLDRLKFILVNKLQLDMFFSNTDKQMLFEKYMIAFVSAPRIGYGEWYPEQTWLVLERIP